MRLVHADVSTGVQIWEDEHAFPRAFLACPAAEAASVEQALTRLPGLRDPRHEIVVEAGTPNPCAAAAPPSGTLTGFFARGNDVRIQYHADTPGILVVADAYEPGWRATVDGAAVAVARVDALFRGVAIGAGDHVIDMHYRPPRWRASLVMAGSGVAVLAVATMLSPRPRRGERS